MANDFKSYVKNGKGKNMSKQEYEKIKQQFSTTDVQAVENFTKQYEGMSQNELMNEISKVAMEGKKDGSLKSSDIDMFVNNILPMLDEEQKKRLGSIVKMLKN